MEVPYNIANYRMEQCKLCPTPCERQKDKEWRHNGDNVCPIGRFSSYARHPKRLRGAGDVVAIFAQPIAKAIDGVFKTRVSTCGGCAKRREALNKIIPF